MLPSVYCPLRLINPESIMICQFLCLSCQLGVKKPNLVFGIQLTFLCFQLMLRHDDFAP